MDEEKNIPSKEVLMMADMFDCLDGQRQMEVLGIFIEKLENGEVELDGKPITPEEIGIEDAYYCCTALRNIVSVGRNLTDQQI